MWGGSRVFLGMVHWGIEKRSSMGGGGGGSSLLLLVGGMLCDSAGKLQLTSFFFFSQDVQILLRRHRITNELGKPMCEGDSNSSKLYFCS